MKRNLCDVRARAGDLFVIAYVETNIEGAPGIHVIRMPEHYGELGTILHVVPLKLPA